MPASNFRDPTTAWRNEDRVLHLAVGASLNSSVGGILVYRSIDFLNWELASTLFSDPTYGNMFECPDFFEMDNTGKKSVVKFSSSSQRRDLFAVGSYNQKSNTFSPIWKIQPLDLGGNVYASKSFFDSLTARRIYFSWVDEGDNKGVQRGFIQT